MERILRFRAIQIVAEAVPKIADIGYVYKDNGLNKFKHNFVFDVVVGN